MGFSTSTPTREAGRAGRGGGLPTYAGAACMQELVYGQGVDGHKHGFQDIKDVVLGRGLVRRAICVVEALQGPHHGCDDPCNSSTNAWVKTVPLYLCRVSMSSLRVPAISDIAMLGLASHSQFQSFNLAKILSSGRFSSALP